MIELINTAVQTVAVGQAVVYNAVPVHSGYAERHRQGSAQVLLTRQGRYLITFSGNIAVPADGTVGEISLGIAQDGEILGGSTMRVTPAAVEEYFNVSTQHYVDVCCECCTNVAVESTSDQAILVDNPNIVVVRVC